MGTFSLHAEKDLVVHNVGDFLTFTDESDFVAFTGKAAFDGYGLEVLRVTIYQEKDPNNSFKPLTSVMYDLMVCDQDCDDKEGFDLLKGISHELVQYI